MTSSFFFFAFAGMSESIALPEVILTSPSDESQSRDQLGQDLNEAVRRGDQQKTTRLISLGADVNYSDPTYGWTPLHNAARDGHFEIFKQLVSKGAEVNSRDLLGQTPLFR